MFNSFEQTHINQYCIKHVRLLFITFVNIFTLQDRKASEKAKEIERVREKQQKELSKQKQIEKDLEEQSRLIAASSRSNPSGGEGHFVVLSSSQSEDSDLGEDGKKKKEYET